MTEETQNVPETPAGGQPTPEPVPAPEPTPAPAPQTPTWDKLLESVDPKELRKHPKVAGMVGSELQRAKQDWETTRTAEDQTKAQQQAKEEMRRLAQSDPDEFIKQWMTEDQRQGIMNQINEMHAKARHEIAQSIGRAFRDVPEWAELTEADHQKLAEQLAGKADEEVLPLFNRLVTELIADRRGRKALDGWKAKELEREREAIRQEEAAKLLKSSEAPDTASPKGRPGKLNIEDMPQEEFDKLWNTLKRT